MTPSTGLRDGQVVTISGSGFRPTAFVSVLQCESVAASAPCDYDTATAVAVAPDGTFSLSYAVSALLVAVRNERGGRLPSGIVRVNCR